MINRCLTLIFQVSILLIPFPLTGQIKCKVLVPALSEIYIGSCKKGLAHGQGIAQGMDRYIGSFKKGLPHGKGKYEWESGEIYEGEFKKGLKHGIGKLTFKWDDRDTVVSGMWLRDAFAEPVFDPPEVITRVHIKGCHFKRLSEGSTVVLSFSGMDPQNIENIFIVVDNGTKYVSGGDLGYNLVKFPFHCRLIIPMEDSSQLIRWDCILEFVIKDPGYWIVQIYI